MKAILLMTKRSLWLMLFTFHFAIGAMAQDATILMRHYQNQDYKAAINYLLPLKDTTSKKWLTEMAYASLMGHQLNNAELYYTQLVTIDTTHKEAYFLKLGNIQERKGSPKKAYEYYKESLNKPSSHLYQLLAKVCSDSTEKIQYLKNVLELEPYNSEASYDLGQIFYDNSHFQKAYDVLHPSWQRDTTDFTIASLLLPNMFKVQKYDECIDLAKRLIKADITPERAYDYLARAYLGKKQYQQTLETLLTIEKSNNKSEYNAYLTALCYQELGKPSQASVYYQKAIDLGISLNVYYYYSLKADMQDQLKKYPQAVKELQKGLSFKTDAWLYYQLAVLYDTKLKQPQKALVYYRKFLETKPSSEKYKAQIEFTKNRIKPT